MMQRLKSFVSSHTGKFVKMSLFIDGQGLKPDLKARILGAGSEGFVVEGESFPWVTSVRYGQVHSICEDVRS